MTRLFCTRAARTTRFKRRPVRTAPRFSYQFLASCRVHGARAHGRGRVRTLAPSAIGITISLSLSLSVPTNLCRQNTQSALSCPGAVLFTPGTRPPSQGRRSGRGRCGISQGARAGRPGGGCGAERSRTEPWSATERLRVSVDKGPHVVLHVASRSVCPGVDDWLSAAIR